MKTLLKLFATVAIAVFSLAAGATYAQENKMTAAGDEIITITSDGRTFLQMINDLEKRGCGYWPGSTRGYDFCHDFSLATTNGVTYRLVVIKGEEFSDRDLKEGRRVVKEAERCGYLTPPAEVAPLLLEKISDEQITKMGLEDIFVIGRSESVIFELSFKLPNGKNNRWLTSLPYSDLRDMDKTKVGFVFLASPPEEAKQPLPVVQRDTVITVTSNGRTPREMIHDLKESGYSIDIEDGVGDIMYKPEFVTTSGITYRLAIIKAEELYRDGGCYYYSDILTEAERRGYYRPPAEVAVLLREKLSDEQITEMGLKELVVMHEPIKGSGGYYDHLLAVCKTKVRQRYNYVFDYSLKAPWIEAGEHGQYIYGDDDAYVFLASSPDTAEGAYVVKRKDEIITVTSDGRTPSEMIEDLREVGFSAFGRFGNIGESDRVILSEAKSAMENPAFVTTSGITYRLVIISGREFSSDKDRQKRIHKEAKRRGYYRPPPEVAPFLFEKISVEQMEEMGLHDLVVAHEPIKTDEHGNVRLGVNSFRNSKDSLGLALYPYYSGHFSKWTGVVFLAPSQEAQ